MTAAAATTAAKPVLGTGPRLEIELTVPRISGGRRQAVLGTAPRTVARLTVPRTVARR